MSQAVTRESMRAMDRAAIDEAGIPEVVLMERAALALREAVLDLLAARPAPAAPERESAASMPLSETDAPVAGRRVGILCGPGNNGGDGLALARLLLDQDLAPVVVLLGAPSAYAGAAATNLNTLRALAIEAADLSALAGAALDVALDAIPPCALWVDALLGTGLARPVEGRLAQGVAYLNRQAHVLAVDLPSGLDADTGQILGACVKAEATVALGATKLGQWIHPGRALRGALRVADIGIPRSIAARFPSIPVLDAGWARGVVPPRFPTYHKGDAGRVLLVAGCREMTGAALLAARGAVRSGAGLLRVATAAEVVGRVALAVPEAMALDLPRDAQDRAGLDALAQAAHWAGAIGAGCGLGQGPGARSALAVLLAEVRGPLVLDADALNLVALDADLRAACRAAAARGVVLLTPHPGEAARLLDCAPAAVLADPLAAARALVDATGAGVVLKGASSIVALPDGRVAINATGNPGMATGGMGDALTGIVAARLAEERDTFLAVCQAVHAHGAAGDAAAEHAGERGLTVVALLDALPGVWKRLERR